MSASSGVLGKKKSSGFDVYCGKPRCIRNHWIIKQANLNHGTIMCWYYSHSFTLVCRGVIPVNSSLLVGFSRLTTESRRMTSRGRLGQTLGQIRKLFRNRVPAVSFLSRGQKREGLGRIIARNGCQNGRFSSLAPVWRSES